MGWASTVVAYLRWRGLGETHSLRQRGKASVHTHQPTTVSLGLMRRCSASIFLLKCLSTATAVCCVVTCVAAQAQRRHLTHVQPRTSSETRQRARAPTNPTYLATLLYMRHREAVPDLHHTAVHGSEQRACADTGALR